MFLPQDVTHPACKVVYTFYLGFISRPKWTMLRRHDDVTTGTSMRRTYTSLRSLTGMKVRLISLRHGNDIPIDNKMRLTNLPHCRDVTTGT